MKHRDSARHDVTRRRLQDRQCVEQGRPLRPGQHMVFKFVTAAAKTWRRLKGENQLPKLVQGVRFQNGIEVIEMSAHHAA
jgi:hypothetical protein